MRLNSIVISNFRNFFETGVIEFREENMPLAIVGNSNSGKSNFIKSLIYGACHKYAGDVSFSANDFYYKDSNKPIGVGVSFSDPIESYSGYNQTQLFCEKIGEDFKVSQKIYSDKGLSTKSLWKDWRRNAPIYFIDTKNLSKQFRIKDSYGRYTIFGRYIKDFKEEILNKKNLYPDEIRGEKISRRKFLSNVVDLIGNRIIKTGDLSSFEEGLGEKIGGNFTFGDIDFDKIFDALELKFSDIEGKPALPLENFGDGFLIGVLLELFKIVSSSDLGGNVFIFDDVENFISEKDQKDFFEVLCELSKKNQVIYTTSSSNFVDIGKQNYIIKLDNSDMSGTRVLSPYIAPNDLSYLSYVDSDINKILFYKKVYLCENLELKVEKQKQFGNDSLSINYYLDDYLEALIEICDSYEIEYEIIKEA